VLAVLTTLAVVFLSRIRRTSKRRRPFGGPSSNAEWRQSLAAGTGNSMTQLAGTQIDERSGSEIGVH